MKEAREKKRRSSRELVLAQGLSLRPLAGRSSGAGALVGGEVLVVPGGRVGVADLFFEEAPGRDVSVYLDGNPDGYSFRASELRKVAAEETGEALWVQGETADLFFEMGFRIDLCESEAGRVRFEGYPQGAGRQLIFFDFHSQRGPQGQEAVSITASRPEYSPANSPVDSLSKDLRLVKVRFYIQSVIENMARQSKGTILK